MAELSVEELSRLARNFLVGRGGEAELEDTKRAMDTDPQLAMEFLQQMQVALDDVAPAGFHPAQWNEIDNRIASVIEPLSKRGVGLGFLGRLFRKLFKKRTAQGPSTIRRRGQASSEPRSEPVQSPVSLAGQEPEAVLPEAALPGDELMEEMAPIAPASAEVPPEQPAVAVSRPVPSFTQDFEPRDEGKAPGSSKAGVVLVLVLAVLALVWAWRHLYKPRPASLPMLPRPVPTLVPTPDPGPPVRAQPQTTEEGPLPSDLPPMTPQAEGRVEHLNDLDAKDSQGHSGLPLP